MLAYRTIGYQGFGDYAIGPTGQNPPTFPARTPFPDIGGRIPSTNTSSTAAVKNNDSNTSVNTTGGAVPDSVPTVFASEGSTVMVPAKKIVGVSPIGLVAIGSALVAAWALFRS